MNEADGGRGWEGDEDCEEDSGSENDLQIVCWNVHIANLLRLALKGWRLRRMRRILVMFSFHFFINNK